MWSDTEGLHDELGHHKVHIPLHLQTVFFEEIDSAHLSLVVHHKLVLFMELKLSKPTLISLMKRSI